MLPTQVILERRGALACLAALLGLWVAFGEGFADTSPPRLMSASERAVSEGAVGFDQRIGQTAAMKVRLRDEQGASVTLAELAQDQPLILVMAYYRCPSLCTLVINGLFEALANLPLRVGRDYRVAIVSIDPREGPPLAAAKKKAYLGRFSLPEASRAIFFLTGDKEASATLAQSIGFRYRYDRESDEFVHPGGMVVLTGEGFISRYLFGVQFPQRDLRLAVVEASKGKLGGLVEQFLLYCYRYDVRSGTYGFYIHRILQFLGLMTIGGLLWLIGQGIRSQNARGV